MLGSDELSPSESVVSPSETCGRDIRGESSATEFPPSLSEKRTVTVLLVLSCGGGIKELSSL